MSYWWLDNVGRGPIEARHRWYMPGMNCTVCGRVWAAGGGSLPTVSIEGTLADSRLKMPPYPEPLAKWLELAEWIRPFVPASEPVEPGLELGPLKGRSAVPFRVTWYTIFGIVLSEEVRDEFASLAPNVALVRADLEGPKMPACYEVELRCYGAELIEEIKNRCDACGYYERVYPLEEKEFCVRNVPDSPLFTLRNAGIMIAHERMIPFFERELGRLLKVHPIQVEM